MNAFGNHHGFAAFARQVDQRLAFPEVLGAAGYMHGDGGFLRREVQAIHQVRADEAHRVVQVQTNFAEVLNQAQGAGAGVAVDRVEPATAGVEQGADQFLSFVLGLFGIAFGGEWLTAAKAVQIVREHHLITGLFQQATGLVVQRHLLRVARRRPHGAGYTGRQIDHTRARVGHRRTEANGFFRLRHRVGPLWDLALG
ncbi:hypothetical protein D3C72_1465620 [compost metagenome]